MKNQRKDSQVLQLEELSWKQIDAFDRDKTIFFLPLSPLEEHGPHLPVGTDFLTARDAAREAIKILQGKNPRLTYVLMPAIPLGHSKIASDFPGTITVNVKTVKNTVYGIGISLARHGFKYLLICTYHMDLGHLKGIYAGMKKTMGKHDIKMYEPSGPYFFNNPRQN